MHEHTLANCRTAARIPLIGNRGGLGNQTGQADLNETIKKIKGNLLVSVVTRCWPKARYIEYESQLKKNPHSSTRRLKFSQLFYFSNDP